MLIKNFQVKFGIKKLCVMLERKHYKPTEVFKNNSKVDFLEECKSEEKTPQYQDVSKFFFIIFYMCFFI